MKNLKKIIFVIMFLLAVLTIGCTPKPQSIGEISDSLLEEVDKLNVKENLNLPTQIDGVTIEWQSSNEEVISNTGVVTRPDKDTYVTLTAVLKNEEKTIETTIRVKVLAKEDDGTYKTITVSEAVELANEYGEDGTIAAFINLLGIPCVGPDILASSIGMDKILQKKVLMNI